MKHKIKVIRRVLCRGRDETPIGFTLIGGWRNRKMYPSESFQAWRTPQEWDSFSLFHPTPGTHRMAILNLLSIYLKEKYTRKVHSMLAMMLITYSPTVLSLVNLCIASFPYSSCPKCTYLVLFKVIMKRRLPMNLILERMINEICNPVYSVYCMCCHCCFKPSASLLERTWKCVSRWCS